MDGQTQKMWVWLALAAIVLIFGILVLFQGTVLNFFFPAPGGVTPRSNRAILRPLQAGRPAVSSLGAQIYEEAKNPVAQKLPEANPFTAQINPFDGLYVNPFR